MATSGTLAGEINDIPALVRARLANDAPCRAIARAIVAYAPDFAITVGRGSSDAVCEALGRHGMVRLGLPTASLPPSIVTVGKAPLRVARTLALAISQSGASPDLVDTFAALRKAGALTVACVNVEGSPLGRASAHVLDIGAGREVSVAATKSVVLSWLTGLMVLEAVAVPGTDFGAWVGVGEAIARSLAIDWSEIAARLDAPALFIVARGPTYAAAREAALKLKELAGLPAEALSGAEIMHGPKAALTDQVAVLALSNGDGHAASLRQSIAQLAGISSRVVTIGADGDLVLPRSGITGPVGAQLDALIVCAALYRLFMAMAVRRGRSPDNPLHLAKITLTR